MGDRALGFPEYRALKGRIFQEPIVEVKKSDVVPPQEELFNQIFSINPKTNLPDGDIAIFMSQNTSPEIKDFIQRNLMSPIDLENDGAKYDGLDDDTLAQYTRDANESVTDYRNRMYREVYSQYLERKKAAEQSSE